MFGKEEAVIKLKTKYQIGILLLKRIALQIRGCVIMSGNYISMQVGTPYLMASLQT